VVVLGGSGDLECSNWWETVMHLTQDKKLSRGATGAAGCLDNAAMFALVTLRGAAGGTWMVARQ